MIIDGDWGKIQEPAIFTEPKMVSKRQLPGERNPQIGLKNNSASDTRAESTKHRGLEPGKFERTQTKQQKAGKYPKNFAQWAGATVEIALRIRGQVNLLWNPGLHLIVSHATWFCVSP